MVLAGAAMVSYTEVSVEANTDLRQALEAAVKAAAFQVTSESQAGGRPDLDPAAAHVAFRDALARNLGLDPVTLAPAPGSALERVDYALAVQTRAGATVFSGGTGSGTSSSGASGGLPAVFSVGPGAEVVPGADSARPVRVTLDTPGAVAAVDAVPVPLAGRTATPVYRWAAAKVVIMP